MCSAVALRELLKPQTQRFAPRSAGFVPTNCVNCVRAPQHSCLRSSARMRHQERSESEAAVAFSPSPPRSHSLGFIAETYFYLLYIQNCAASCLLQAVLQGNLDAATCCLELSCATGTPQGCLHPARHCFTMAKPFRLAQAKAQGPLPALLGPCPGRSCISAL